MDTSKEYIEMIDNPWIQGDEAGYPVLMFGDYFIRRTLFEMGKEQGVKNFRLEILYDYRSQAIFTCTTDTSRNYIRVLRQDQLQDIISKYNDYDHWYETFQNFLHFYGDINISNINSMEQLWLAFVMWELWGKKWSGTDRNHDPFGNRTRRAWRVWPETV